jgi:hypothetical protein
VAITQSIINNAKLLQILASLDSNTEQAIRALAFAVENKAKQYAVVDTGAMRSSIYTKTSKFDGGPAAHGEAVSKNGEVSGMLQRLPNPKGNEAYIGPTVSYAIAVEFGSGSASRVAKPFLVRALREVEDAFIAKTFAKVATGG